MDVPYGLLSKWLKENDGFRKYIEDRYKTELEYYQRFEAKNGRNCPIAKSALRRIFQLEITSSAREGFISAITRGIWGTC